MSAEQIEQYNEEPEQYRGPKWRNFAECLDEDSELFFPIGTTGPALMQIEEAKAVCRACRVSEICLQWALDSGSDHGVWGGKSEGERRALKKRKQ
jgi:WhiB family redox-sensing transcriptional regulator